MHLSTEEPAASRMLEPFGEVGGDAPEYFLLRTHLLKLKIKKLLRKIRSKNLSAGVFFFLVYKWFTDKEFDELRETESESAADQC